MTEAGTEIAIIDATPIEQGVVAIDAEYTGAPPTAVATIPPVDQPIGSMGNMMQIAQACALSGFYKDCRTGPQALVKMMAGREMGIGPIAALTLIHIIEGRPTAGATVFAAKVKSSGRYDYRVIRRDVDVCELEWTDRGQVVGRSCWTMADAERAKLAKKDNWRNHPRAMLFANALKEGMRVFCPEICCGVYATEELAPDLEISESGEVSPEAWDRFCGPKSNDSQEEKKEKPVSAMEAMRKAAGLPPDAGAGQQGVVVNSAGAAAVVGGHTVPPYSPATDNGFPCTKDQESQILTYLRAVNPPVETFKKILASYGASKISELTTGAADDVIAKLSSKIAQKGMASIAAGQAAAAAQLNQPASHAAANPTGLPEAAGPGLSTVEQRETLRQEFARINANAEMLEKYLGLVKRANFRELTIAEADQLIAHLKSKPTPAHPN